MTGSMRPRTGSCVATDAPHVGQPGPGYEHEHGPEKREERGPGPDFTLHHRPERPGEQHREHRPDRAEGQGAQDSHGLPARVEQTGGATDEESDQGEVHKVRHHVFFLLTHERKKPTSRNALGHSAASAYTSPGPP